MLGRAGEHDQRRTMAERQVRQPASELSFHYFIGHGFTRRRGGTVWDPGGPYSEHVSDLRVSVRRTREDSLAVTTSASTGLLG